MLGWVVRGIGDNSVCAGWFPVYGGYPFCWGLANSNVQKIYLVVRFWSAVNFMFGWSVLKSSYVFEVSVAGIINYQSVINIAKVCSDVVFAKELHEVCVF